MISFSSIFKRNGGYISGVLNCMILAFVLDQSITIHWFPNKESDLAGYKIYYGHESRSYSWVIGTGRVTEFRITDLQPGKKYFFAVTAYDTAGNESSFSDEVAVTIPDDDNIIDLEDQTAYNFPNPFRPGDQVTKIRYYLAQAETVTIAIYDIKATMIRSIISDIFKSVGEHTEDVWDGRNDKGEIVPNGIYIAKVSSQSATHYITIAVLK